MAGRFLTNLGGGGFIASESATPDPFTTPDGVWNVKSDIALDSTKKLYLDGGGNSWIAETTSDDIEVFLNGTRRISFTHDGTDTALQLDSTSLKFWRAADGASSTGQLSLFRGGTDANGIFMFKRYGNDFTIVQIQSPTGSFTQKEATLSLVLYAEPDTEFEDYYVLDTQHGRRSQKRGTGSYRDYVNEWASSSTDIEEFCRIRRVSATETKMCFNHNGGAISTAIFEVNKDNVTTTTPLGLLLQNRKAAISGTQQFSPVLVLEAQGWKTDATAASQAVQFGFQSQSIQGTSAPTGELHISSQITAADGETFTSQAVMDSGGFWTKFAVKEGTTGVGISFDADKDTFIRGDAANSMQFKTANAERLLLTTNLFLSVALLPTDVTYGLGSTTKRFLTMYGGNDAVGVAATEVLFLQNKTAAAAGAQKWSPVLTLEGRGWKTDATAASQVVKFGLQTRSVEGTANPTGGLHILQAIDAGSYASVGAFLSGGGISMPSGTATAPAYAFSANVDCGLFLNSDTNVEMSNNNSAKMTWTDNYVQSIKFIASSDATHDLGGTSNAWRDVYCNRTSVGTAATEQIILKNTTAAAAGAQQFSGVLTLEGKGWKTNATAASQVVKFGLRTRPIEGAANPTGAFDIMQAIDAGSLTTTASFLSGGGIAVANGTEPSAGTADNVISYSIDDAAGHTIPGFYCEGTNVLATGQADSASSVRVKMRVNGTTVTLLAI